MSKTVHLCDATGNPVLGDFVEMNELAPRIYSPDAAEAVREYQRKRDALHDRLAEDWKLSLAVLREEWREKFPNGKLPDEF